MVSLENFTRILPLQNVLHNFIQKKMKGEYLSTYVMKPLLFLHQNQAKGGTHTCTHTKTTGQYLPST